MTRLYEAHMAICNLTISLSGHAQGTEIRGEESLAVDVQTGTFHSRKNVEAIYINAHNISDRDLAFSDLYLDISNGCPMPEGGEKRITDSLRIAGDAEDWYLLMPLSKSCQDRLLLFPYDTTQLDFCEEQLDGRFRCYLSAQSLRKDRRCESTIWTQLPRTTTFKPNEKKTWVFLAVSVRTEAEVASTLLTYGRTPMSVSVGANIMRSIPHHFDDYETTVSVHRQLANDNLAAIITNGLLSKLDCIRGGVTAIAEGYVFGHALVHTTDGVTLSTMDGHCFTADDGSLRVNGSGLQLSVYFELRHGVLRYILEVENIGKHATTLDDVCIPLPLNSEMGWGINPAERMLRHSQVAGDNSFFLAVPCDNKPPYLLCMPEDGTAWEAFDHADEHGPSVGYTLHLQGMKVAQDAANRLGGRWRLPVTSLTLDVGESKRYSFDFQWVDGYDEARRELVKAGKVTINAIPGFTVPRDQDLLLYLTGQYDDIHIEAEHSKQTTIVLERKEFSSCNAQTYNYLFRIHMNKLGENRLAIRYANNHVGWLECFATLSIPQVIEARAKYICHCQTVDDAKWYDGLFCDRNTLTGEILDPDHHGEMPRDRRYAITCDDPALSRPAFLSSKNAEIPDFNEIAALDRYCENFVWGGLQRTDIEEYPYAVYGVPDWRENRDRRNLNATELLHIWRIYDYPHIALIWFNMYRIAKAKPSATSQTPVEYLRRAYGTYLAMYQYPFEVEQSYGWTGRTSCQWNPYHTGFYNELSIVDVIDALRREGMFVAARRLEFHWGHKVQYFMRLADDLFTSECPFDTTGFESMQAAVDWGRAHATNLWNDDVTSLMNYTSANVEMFDYKQREANIACRGFIESAYYLTGSDIRSDSSTYTLSYMSQMGGQALMQDALYATGNPFPLLRLASASLLSSWALVNAGDKEDNYGYWFPGKANNGSSAGGFEPSPAGISWLGQPAYHGVWQFGSETDLGYCGYLRGAATIVADDPDFGRVVYGGVLHHADDGVTVIYPADGVSRRFHIIKSESFRIHILVEGARIYSVRFTDNANRIRIVIDFASQPSLGAHIKVFGHQEQAIFCAPNGMTVSKLDLPLSKNTQIVIETLNNDAFGA